MTRRDISNTELLETTLKQILENTWGAEGLVIVMQGRDVHVFSREYKKDDCESYTVETYLTLSEESKKLKEQNDKLKEEIKAKAKNLKLIEQAIQALKS